MSLADGSKSRINRKAKYKKPTLQRLEKRIKNVYKNIKQEIKIHDSVYTFNPSRDNSTGDNIRALTAIAQGDTDITRDGNQINVKSIQVKGQIYMDVAVGQSQTVRMIIFRDNNYLNATVPTPAMILEPTAFGTSDAPYGMRNRRERDRFKVIYDKLFTLNTSGANTLPFNIYRRVNTKTTFADVTNSAYGKNSFWLMVISGAGATGRPTVNSISRVSFTDS